MTWSWLAFSSVGRALHHAVSQMSCVQIPHRFEFFSGLIFTTDQVVIITARIAFVFASLSAVHLCDFRTQYKEYYEANGAEVELTDDLEI